MAVQAYNKWRVVQENLPNLGENCKSLWHGKGRGFTHPLLWPHFSEVTRLQTAAAQGHGSLSLVPRPRAASQEEQNVIFLILPLPTCCRLRSDEYSL